jgi:hypothetical protein
LIRIKDTTAAAGDITVMQNAAQKILRAHPTHQAEDLLENARKSFMLADKAEATADILRFAAIGREYLERAHAAARVDEQQPMRRNWD